MIASGYVPNYSNPWSLIHSVAGNDAKAHVAGCMFAPANDAKKRRGPGLHGQGVYDELGGIYQSAPSNPVSSNEQDPFLTGKWR